MADNVVIFGAQQLDFKLRRLAAKDAKKAIRKGTRAGSKIVTAKAKKLAPVESGLVRRAIRTRALKRSRNTIGTITVLGKAFFKGASFYGAFVEFGHKIGSRKLPTRKEVAGQHFIERAAKQVGRKAGEEAVRVMAREIENAARV